MQSALVPAQSRMRFASSSPGRAQTSVDPRCHLYQTGLRAGRSSPRPQGPPVTRSTNWRPQTSAKTNVTIAPNTRLATTSCLNMGMPSRPSDDIARSASSPTAVTYTPGVPRARPTPIVRKPPQASQISRGLGIKIGFDFLHTVKVSPRPSRLILGKLVGVGRDLIGKLDQGMMKSMSTTARSTVMSSVCARNSSWSMTHSI